MSKKVRLKAAFGASTQRLLEAITAIEEPGFILQYGYCGIPNSASSPQHIHDRYITILSKEGLFIIAVDSLTALEGFAAALGAVKKQS